MSQPKPRSGFWGRLANAVSRVKNTYLGEGGSYEDISHITMVRTSSDQEGVFLGLQETEYGYFIVLHVGFFRDWEFRPLLKVKSLKRARKALRSFRKGYISGEVLPHDMIVETFKTYYGAPDEIESLWE